MEGLEASHCDVVTKGKEGDGGRDAALSRDGGCSSSVGGGDDGDEYDQAARGECGGRT